MNLPVFFIAFLAAVSCYGFATRVVDRRLRVESLRRLTGAKAKTQGGPARATTPALMQIVDGVRGKLALSLLERLKLKKKVEQVLETASLKWGAAGLAHR